MGQEGLSQPVDWVLPLFRLDAGLRGHEYSIQVRFSDLNASSKYKPRIGFDHGPARLVKDTKGQDSVGNPGLGR